MYTYIYIPYNIAKARDKMKRTCFPHVRNTKNKWRVWTRTLRHLEVLVALSLEIRRVCHMSNHWKRGQVIPTKKKHENQKIHKSLRPANSWRNETLKLFFSSGPLRWETSSTTPPPPDFRGKKEDKKKQAPAFCSPNCRYHPLAVGLFPKRIQPIHRQWLTSLWASNSPPWKW